MPKRVLQGSVVSDKMQKTVVVAVERRTQHPLYKKVITRTKKYHAHDETNECNLGDLVRIEEARPYSRTKRWRVVEVLRRGDVAEVQPQAIGRELETTVQRSLSADDEAEESEATAGAPAEDTGEDAAPETDDQVEDEG